MVFIFPKTTVKNFSELGIIRVYLEKWVLPRSSLYQFAALFDYFSVDIGQQQAQSSIAAHQL